MPRISIPQSINCRSLLFTAGLFLIGCKPEVSSGSTPLGNEVEVLTPDVSLLSKAHLMPPDALRNIAKYFRNKNHSVDNEDLNALKVQEMSVAQLSALSSPPNMDILTGIETKVKRRILAISKIHALVSSQSSTSADISNLDLTSVSTNEEAQIISKFGLGSNSLVSQDWQHRIQQYSVINTVDERVFFRPGMDGGKWDKYATAVGIVYKGSPTDPLVVVPGPVDDDKNNITYCGDPRRNLAAKDCVGTCFLLQDDKGSTYICTAKHVMSESMLKKAAYSIMFEYIDSSVGNLIPDPRKVMAFPLTNPIWPSNGADIALYPISSHNQGVPLRISHQEVNIASPLVCLGYPNKWALNIGGNAPNLTRVATSFSNGLEFTTNLSISQSQSGSPVLDSTGCVIGIAIKSVAENQFVRNGPGGCFVEMCGPRLTCDPGSHNYVAPIAALNLD